MPYLSARRRLQLLIVFVIMLFSSFAEVFSLAAVVPFLAVLVEPERIWQLDVVQRIAPTLGIDSAEQLLMPVTILFGSVAILAAAVRLLNLWLNGRIAAAIGSDLSCEAYRRTLLQPYQVHAARNSSTVIAALVGQVSQLVSGVLNPILQFVTSGLILLGLLVTLMFVDWQLTLLACALFTVSYGVIVLGSKRRLLENSQIHASMNVLQVQALQEGLGAIRDVILDGSQSHYLDIYSRADRPIRRVVALSGFIATFPRYAMEAIAMVVIAIMAYSLSDQYGGLAAAVPVLGAFALGAQRLLPALQQTYSGWAVIRSSRAALEAVLALLEQPVQPTEELTMLSAPLQIQRSLNFEKVRFRYSADGPWILDSVSFSIAKGERVGFIGTTGTGKSTTVDLLMGLLEPSEGSVDVDGLSIHGDNNQLRLRAWRDTVAHVPQSIYLADTSIAENIAFGRPRELIDMNRVRFSAQQAQIAAFIESTANSYETRVGERGIRLSGGQRQRIGIARALYKQAAVLVFDEATSALDNATEAALMETIESLSRELTIIVIAHRLSTVARCDRVFELGEGRILRELAGSAVLSTQQNTKSVINH